MLKIENTEVMGWEAAIRGMRNPMNSWDRGDSGYVDCDHMRCSECPTEILGWPNCCDYHDRLYIGPNDLDLMKRLASAGSVHGKFRRMITVYVDITAPLYW